jgi:hypothetical protein
MDLSAAVFGPKLGSVRVTWLRPGRKKSMIGINHGALEVRCFWPWLPDAGRRQPIPSYETVVALGTFVLGVMVAG